ncbi:MAG: prepilin-type N-terminal cleavage/methylation domain-containing protein [Elusimicrobiota bacterium]
MLPKKKNGGFTLIELSISSGLLAIVVVVVIGLFNAAIKSWRLGEIENILDMNISNVLSHLDRDLKKAKTSTIVIDNYPNVGNPKVQRITFKSSLNSLDTYVYFVPDVNYNQIKCFINGEPAPYSPICPVNSSDNITIEELKFNLISSCHIILELKKCVDESKFKNRRMATAVTMRVN